MRPKRWDIQQQHGCVTADTEKECWDGAKRNYYSKYCDWFSIFGQKIDFFLLWGEKKRFFFRFGGGCQNSIFFSILGEKNWFPEQKVDCFSRFFRKHSILFFRFWPKTRLFFLLDFGVKKSIFSFDFGGQNRFPEQNKNRSATVRLVRSNNAETEK